MNHLFKKLMLSSTLLFSVCTYPATPVQKVDIKKGLYGQITPELLKNINIENPNEAEQNIINACRAVNEFGTEYPEVPSEIMQAISSIDMARILSQYARNITIFGRIGLITNIAQMTDNVQTLQNKQALIKHFEQNPDTVVHFTKALNNTIKAESKFLDLFKKLTEQEEAEQQKIKNTVYFSSPAFTKLNEQKYTLETIMRAKYALPALSIASMLIVPTVMDAFADGSSSSFRIKISNATYNNIVNLPSLPNKYVEMLTPGLGKKGAIAYTTLILGLKAFDLYQTAKNIKGNLDLTYEKQKDLIVVGHLIKSMQIISQTISHDNALTTLMSAEHAKLSELFDPNSIKTSADLKYLINELLSSSFQGSESYLFSKQGKILATHHLLNRIKGELIPYLETLGQVDAHLAVFTLYKEFKNHPRVTFCLPEFVQADAPMLQAQGYWHPLINPNFVVTNDVTMGQGTANLIITGPNAGGKTTSLMSLIINIIFAQSFGIAPSNSLKMTPFAKIHSYLDITTNLQEGLSLFAAEVDRAKKLKISIQSCTPGQKTFTIIDEIFSGTNPDVASDIGFKFVKQLGEMTHSMAIITTHFPRLTDLEKETTRFKNYKVADAIIAANGAISYPFKLVKGASTQNIAQHMLSNEGII